MMRALLSRLPALPAVSVRLDRRDMWVGLFWDPEEQRLYWCPLPLMVVQFGGRR